MSLTARERFASLLSKNDPTLDRHRGALAATSRWMTKAPEHWPAATLDFQHHYDFDLVKVTPASSFFDKGIGEQMTPGKGRPKERAATLSIPSRSRKIGNACPCSTRSRPSISPDK